MTLQHKDAAEAEMLGRVAVFHDEVQERKIVKDDIMFKAYYGAYWLVKEEISNRKFQSLLDLLKFLGLDEMEHFQYFSAVAFYFAWKFYKLPSQSQSNEGLNRESASSQITIVDGHTKKMPETELIPVAQFITVSDSGEEKPLPSKDFARTTNV